MLYRSLGIFRNICAKNPTNAKNQNVIRGVFKKDIQKQANRIVKIKKVITKLLKAIQKDKISEPID